MRQRLPRREIPLKMAVALVESAARPSKVRPPGGRNLVERSWRYDALVADYHKSMGRLAAYKAEYRQLAKEHTALIEKLQAWKTEKENTGRLVSARTGTATIEEDGPYAPVPQETHDRIAARMAARKKNGRVIIIKDIAEQV